VRLLVTGAAGFVGGRLLRDLARGHEVVGARHAREAPGLERADLTDEAAARGLLERVKPGAVVHCAALADPDACEKDPERARAVNARAPGVLARLCKKSGVRLIHVSTDLVFDGKRGGYSEADAAAPLSVYGRTKLEGEAAVLAEDPSAAVVRVSLVYGRSLGGRPSFLDWLRSELSAGRRPRLFTDQWRTPTAMVQLPEVLGRLASAPLSGVFHWGGAESVTRLEFGRAVCRVFGYSQALLEPVSMDGFGYAAARPRDCSLDSGKLARALSLLPLGLEAGLSAER
jgi:dTDP-4-dehydrorhamnose reductase